MAFYQYKAVTPSGEVQEGVLEASSTAAAVARVQSMGMIPIRAEEAGVTKAAAAPGQRRALFARRSVRQDDIVIVTRELATLLRAGLPLDRAFEILINLAPHARVGELLARIRNDVRGGSSLSKALEAQKGVFSRFYVNLIRAGEAGGSLPSVLLRLAEYLERSKALRDNVRASLTYPAFLGFFSIAAVIILLGFVVPRFKPIFAGAGKAVPTMTQVVLFMGDAMRNYGWLLLCIVVLGAWVFARRLRDPEVRYRLDRRKVTAPIVGDLFSKVEMASFARTLGTLLGNGVTLVAALNIVRETMSNSWLAEAIGSVARELKEGRGLGRPMMETGRFPMLAVHMILVGEETGRLDEMLMQVADTYDNEVDVAIRKALALLQPAIIVAMAAVIGFIIIAILSAMLSVYDIPL
ncbi:MAG TPA: type II secretion system F family protein [Usitatibacter sp.]|jgi:general secretion pathway protein F|nr:type II secretion system F family protein [Usitatibacter sp.]